MPIVIRKPCHCRVEPDAWVGKMTDQAQKPPAKPSIGANPPGPVPITSTTGSWLLQLARYGLAIVALVAAGVGGVVWWLARDIATENAYVVGNVTPISPEVAGNVVALFTDDNMVVKAGEPLLQIDPVPHQLAVEEARADYRQALKELEGAAITVRLTDQDRKAGYQAAEARRQEQEESLRASALEASARDNILNKEKETLQASRAEEPGLQALERNARDYLERFDSLAKSGDIPMQDRDNKDAAWKDSLARLIEAIDFAQTHDNGLEVLVHLDSRIGANKRDFEARFDRARLLLAHQKWTEAMDELLEILMRDKAWNWPATSTGSRRWCGWRKNAGH